MAKSLTCGPRLSAEHGYGSRLSTRDREGRNTAARARCWASGWARPKTEVGRAARCEARPRNRERPSGLEQEEAGRSGAAG
jgi:hypothetical protein